MCYRTSGARIPSAQLANSANRHDGQCVTATCLLAQVRPLGHIRLVPPIPGRFLQSGAASDLPKQVAETHNLGVVRNVSERTHQDLADLIEVSTDGGHKAEE